jgi:hypothetical protein
VRITEPKVPIFFHAKNVSFNTGTSSILGVPDLRDCKTFPLKVALHYACVSFNTGLAVYFLNETLTHRTGNILDQK